MFLKLTPQRDGLYLWAIALLFLAKLLAPSAVMAFAPDDVGKRWVYLCGSLQNKWVQLDADDTPDGEMVVNDCPLCGLFKLYNAAPPVEEQSFESDPFVSSQPVTDELVVTVISVDLTTSPRAPPLMH